MSKHYNPLLNNNSVKSESGANSVESTSGAFVVASANVCPKCSSTTVPTKLLSGEDVMFCTGCRVSLAIPLE
ncbi:hypothetical protein pEaSNUABM30_00005 [Erwinia phage pEa_SNUABM_30]|uniref:Uncharacterized protein n=1 Tax=Erwinia phage pEa_SNUABM_30 TaxID=2869553 RepID=A0AAE8XL37_9CAUD|nr:DNA ligase [Erwinia phage pEa_SNUABM_30]UAW53123.1 hypothetical protein pEaSNUABM30_00005 [Erwinia phage pEa_SNUABM_30]